MNTPVNCTDSELSTFLQGLAEGYLPTYYSDTSPSAPSRLNLIASKSYTHGKKTVSFLGFPSLTMLKHSMESRGGDLSKSSPEVSRAKTYPAREKGPESAEKEADYGQKWQEWFAKLDPVTSLWKTRQCSLFEDLDKSLETWPRWGMMRDGACLELAMPERPTSGSEYGYLDTWPTPTVNGWRSEGAILQLREMVDAGVLTEGMAEGMAEGTLRPARMRTWATPCAGDYRSPNLNPCKNGQKIEPSSGHALPAQVGGQLNPTWVEWLMGWAIGWTDLKPLEMDKCHNALLSHGEHSAKE